MCECLFHCFVEFFCIFFDLTSPVVLSCALSNVPLCIYSSILSVSLVPKGGFNLAVESNKICRQESKTEDALNKQKLKLINERRGIDVKQTICTVAVVLVLFSFYSC